MHGEKISDLAHNAKTDKKSFAELKDKVSHITNKVVRKYMGLADKDDLQSMCYISLINCVRTFDKTKGLFEPHYLQRAYQEVKREIIKSSLIRIPEAIINLSRRMVPAHKELLSKSIIAGTTHELKFLATIYGTTIRQIKKVYEIKNVVSELGTFVIDTEDLSEDVSEKEIEKGILIDKLTGAMVGLDDTTIRIVLLNSGVISGNPQPFTKIAELLGVGVESVRKSYKRGIEYLREKEELKELL